MSRVGIRLALGLLLLAAGGRTDVGAKPLPVPFHAEYHAELWGLEEGFPQNSCSGVVRSPDGYLWLSTFRGLVRFNGQTFRPWAPASLPFLATTSIISMYQDSRQRTWLSTMEGLVMNDGATWKHWGAGDGWDQPTDYVRSFAEDGNGTVALGTFSGRVLKLENDRFRELPKPGGNGGALCAYDRLGTLYVVRTGFVGVLAHDAWTAPADEPNLSRRAVGAGQSRDGRALIVCRDEILRLQEGRVTARRPLAADVQPFWRLTEDDAGTLWLAAVEAGVYRIRPDGQVKHFLKPDGLPHSGGTRVVHVDQDESIWIGSGVGGFTRFRPARFRYLGESEGLADREIMTLAPLPDGRVLFTPYGVGLAYFDGVSAVHPLAPSGVSAAYFRSALRTRREGAMWLGTFSRGLLQLEGTTLTRVATDIFAANETVSSLFEDSRDRLWAGGDQHVAVRENGTFRAITIPEPIRRQPPSLFAECRDGTMLLAQHNTVFVIAGDTLRPEPYLRLPDDHRLATVLVDRDDRLWIGTLAHGLMVCDRGALHRLTPERGLPSATISALVQDDLGRLWFGSGRKIVRGDPAELWQAAADVSRQVPFQLFDRSDGLRELDFPYGSQPAVAKDDRGRLWFALIRGAAMVDPALLKFNAQPPKVVVESISYVRDGAKQPTELELSAAAGNPSLPPGSRLIRINYAALDFVAPDKQRFRVRLDTDDDWQDMERETTISFLELPPGRHTLQVQASGGDGTWNLSGARLAFELRPFYWQTGWFRGLIAIGVAGLIGGGAWFAAERRTRVTREKLERDRRLAEAQTRLALVLENTSDFVAFVDAKEDIAYVNRAGRALVGMPPGAEVTSASVGTIMPRWARDEFKRVALPAALHGGAWSGESALLHSDGHEIPVSQVILAHRRADGGLDFVSMIARDISAAKRHSAVQDALRKLATSLTAALQPRSLGATVADACRTLFAHEAFFLVLINARGDVELGAYMEDTEVGETSPRAVPPSIESLSPRMRPVLEGTPLLVNRADESAPTSAAVFNVWGHVERRSQSLMFAPVLWEGQVVGIISVQSYAPRRYRETDLQLLQTLADHCGGAIARMKAEALLRKNEERLRLAMQTAQMGSWEIDVGTRRLLASPEAEQVYGRAAGTLSGPLDHLVADVAEPAAGDLRELLEGLLRGDTSEIDHTHRLALRDGAERWLELKAHRVERADAAGAVRIIGLTADITSRRHAELERARLEEQLRQSQKLEAIGTLAGGIAHDFNNILTAILGNAELALIDTPRDEPTREFLDKIKQSGQRARDLVRRILAFSRPHEMRRQPTAVPPVVDEVVKLLRSTIPAGVDISVTVGPDLPLVEIDSTELHQVLLNLGTNAWHALESRHGRIRFALDTCTVGPGSASGVDLPSGRYVRIAVSDTGRGIGPEVMPRIFDPFFTTKAPGEGTGLGLSVVHGIMRANGGAITVHSAVGAGSTFELYFPVNVTRPATAALVRAKPPPPVPMASRGEHILFVDDEDSLVLIAERVFRRAGYTVTTCLRPKQALEVFRQDPAAVHLVVSDLSMPEMTGIDLAAELLRLKPDLPIILTSGYLRTGEAETALRTGVREVVEKPNTPHDLLPLVARLLRDAAAGK